MPANSAGIFFGSQVIHQRSVEGSGAAWNFAASLLRQIVARPPLPAEVVTVILSLTQKPLQFPFQHLLWPWKHDHQSIAYLANSAQSHALHSDR